MYGVMAIRHLIVALLMILLMILLGGRFTTALAQQNQQEPQTSAAGSVEYGESQPASAPLYPPDTVYVPISTTIPLLPEYQATIIDTTTQTKIKRITQLDPLYGGYPTHSYSKNQPWNADATLYKFYTVAVHNAESGQLVKKIAGLGLYESFWSNTDPDLLYSFTVEGAIQTYRLSSEKREVLFTLAGYDKVRLGPGEGNIDIYDQYVALVGKKGEDLDVIVFDLQKKKVINTTTFAKAWGPTNGMPEHIDWVSVSQSGRYVVINWDTGLPRDIQPFDGHFGVEVYNRTDMTFQRRLIRYGNHGDLCFTPSGEEVYTQFWGDKGTINSYHLADGQIDVVHTHSDFGVESAHLSCRNILRPGWAYVSIDRTKGGMIIALKLDGSETIEYFGHHFSSDNSYLKAPMPVPAPDGSKVMFKSDFGHSSNPDEIYAFVASYASPQQSVQIMLPIIFQEK